MATLIAHLTAAGNLIVTETDAVVLSDVDTANGSITVNAGGQVTATDVVSLTDNDANDISITTTAGGIVAGIINAGTQGDINLTSFTTITDAAGKITGDVLTVNAGGAATLDTTVATLIAHLTAAGNLIVTETDAVVLSDVDTANGSITVNAGGQVTATDVVSLTDNDANDISITTTAGGIVAGIINAGTQGDINLTSFTTITDAAGKITGDVLTVNAGGAATLDTTVATLIAHLTAAGDLVVTETDAIVLSDVDTANGPITVNAGGQVTATDVVSLTDNDANDISITTTAGGIVAGIINAGTQGDINLTSFTTITDAAGKITGDVLTVNAGGAATLDTTVATLIAHLTAAGNLIVTETDAIVLSDVDTANGPITVTAGGQVTATDVVSLTDNDANDISITTTAGGIVAGIINAGTQGDINLTSFTTITDAAGKITGDVLTVNAGGAATLDTTVATLIAHLTAAGNLIVTETDAVVLSDVDTANGSITVNAGGQVTATDVVSLTDNDANDISITTTAGGIVAGIINAGTQGDINLTSFTTITDAAGKITGDVLTVNAGGAATLDTTVATLIAHLTAAGNLIVTETDAIVLSDVDTANGPITVTAGGQVTATDVVSLTDNDANDISITTTAGGIVAGIINAGTQGDINLTSFTTITDAAGKITGDVLTVNAGGAATLDTTVATLIAHLTAAGDLVVTETDALVLADIKVFSGNIILNLGGSITINDGADNDGIGLALNGSNNLRIASPNDIILNADVRLGTGSVTILAGGGVSFGSGVVDVVTNGGVVDVEAGSGSVVMAEGSTVVSGGGNVRVVAGGSVVIGLLDARSGGAQDTWGNVQVTALTGGIGDAGGNSSTSVRVYGQSVSLTAAGNVGGINTPVFRLQYTTDFVTWNDLVTVSTGEASVTYVDGATADSQRFYRVAYGTAGVDVRLRAPVVQVDRSVRLTWDVTYTGAYVPVTKALAVEAAVLAVTSGAGSVAVNDVSSVTVGDVTVGYRTVGVNGVLGGLVDDGVKSDVVTQAGNGGVYVRALSGNLMVTEGSTAGYGVSASGSGNVLLGATGSVTLGASVLTGSGQITVTGAAGVTMSVGTVLATSGGEVSVTAGAGSVTLTGVSTGGGDVRVLAAGSVTVGTINAGAGRVSVIAAGGNILAGVGSVNVVAVAVRLSAGGSVGLLNDDLVMQTGVVTVVSGGVARLTNAGALTLGSVSVAVWTVGTDGVVTEVTDATQSGVSTVNSLVVMNDGSLTVGAAVGVSGTGHLLLSATGNLTVDNGVTVGNGSASVLAGGALSLNANVGVTGGTAEVVAQGGDLTMGGSVILAGTGGIRAVASGAVMLGVLDARNGGVWGDVSVLASGGSVVDAGADTLVNVYGRNVRLSATGTAGTLVPAVAEALELEAQTLAVGGTSVNVVLSSGVTVGTLGAQTVNRVLADGTLGSSSDVGSLGGISATTGIVVRTLNGNLAVQTTITNSGSGNVLLSATGGNVSAGAGANVSVAGGSLSVVASGNVTLADGIVLGVTGGTADIAALGGSVVMGGSTTVRTVGANIRVVAATDVALGLLDARNGGVQSTWGDVSVTAGSGRVTDGGDDVAVDVYGRNLRVVAGVGIGVTGSNVVETEVVLFAASVGNGGISLVDASGLAVGTVAAVNVNRVQNDGSAGVVVGDAGVLTGAVKTGGLMALDTADGSNIAGFPKFEVTDTLTGLSAANVFTGYYEQRVRITNTTGSTIDAVRVAISNLPAGVTVMNAAGTLVDGRAYVMFNQTLGVNEVAVLTIEYKVPTVAQMPVAAAFEVDVTGVQAQPSVAGGTQLLTGVQTQRLVDNRYVVTLLQSLAGRTYLVQYSDNGGLTWTTVLSPVTGTGANLNWLDQGPPKSYPDPNTVTLRSYRIFLMP